MRISIKNGVPMTTKNIAIALILSATITSAPCSGMDYMSKSYNAATAMVADNMTYARGWTKNFITKIRSIGILTTLYATFGMYDFNKITGLDKEKLESYNQEQLQEAMHKLELMRGYYPKAQELQTFQRKLHEASSQKEEEELPYNEEEAIEEIQKLLNEKQ